MPIGMKRSARDSHSFIGICKTKTRTFTAGKSGFIDPLSNLYRKSASIVFDDQLNTVLLYKGSDV
ncbi:MAG: hypothetical protein Greene101449_869 [Candidatus Peregrinibacteria bacterium Greene1014_49]|nr:MAG: hypothetical protein Greene101449_869 [Candidatus Peregrinibacteria bacterium Greene1014_49]